MSTVTTDAGRVPVLEAEIERLRAEVGRLVREALDDAGAANALQREVERLHDERVAALALVADVRFACGDYGQRMQPDLLEYLRGLAADAARYRWLRRKFGIVAAVDGAQFCALNMPRPAYIAPDAAAELDAAIKARTAAGERVESLAAEFGVHPTTVSRVINGKTWRLIDLARRTRVPAREAMAA